MVAGLVAFAVVMLLEITVAIYAFFSMNTLYSADPGVQEVVAVLRALSLVALAFLTHVALK